MLLIIICLKEKFEMKRPKVYQRQKILRNVHVLFTAVSLVGTQ